MKPLNDLEVGVLILLVLLQIGTTVWLIQERNASAERRWRAAFLVSTSIAMTFVFLYSATARA